MMRHISLKLKLEVRYTHTSKYITMHILGNYSL